MSTKNYRLCTCRHSQYHGPTHEAGLVRACVNDEPEACRRSRHMS